MADDISNRFVRNIFSIEMLIMLVIIGISWGTLATGQSSHTDSIDENKQQIESMKKSLHTIETDTAIIKNEQKHFGNKLEDQDAKIERILKILEER